ncbi:MAG: ubiquitin-like protein Pup [Patescibacteria group bacterium]
MGKEQVQKKSHEKEEKREEVKANPETVQKGEKLKKDINDVLDKIDDVLEENAEEFVRNYVQKGGE